MQKLSLNPCKLKYAVRLTADEHHAAYRQAAYELLQQNGWSHRITSLEQFTALVNASACNFIALKDGQVIGYIRGITDGLSNGYISMLVVASDYRKQGVGRDLVQAVINSAPSATWVLRAGCEGSANFFEKLGFEVSTMAMERNRKT